MMGSGMRVFSRNAIFRTLLLGVLALVCVPAEATAPELSIKAAYLYKFASYIEWPQGTFSSTASPLVLGVIGDDPLADELAQVVAGQVVGGHPVVTRQLSGGDALAGVNILLIGNIDNALLLRTLTAAKEQAVLTVTESEDSYAQGSMINLRVIENKIRFEVSLTPVELAHLKISARMLSAAYSVNRGQK
jgi:hypothetical protein